jgi:hypothetical protein
MGAAGQPTSEILFACSGILSFILLVALSLWCNRLWKLRGYHLNDYRRLMIEARWLHTETIRIKREVEDDLVDTSVKLKHSAILNAASEWDTGLRIALGAWEDAMQPNSGSRGDGNEEKGEKLNDRMARAQGRYIIGLIRTKCLDGVQRRKELSPLLQKIHSEVISRYVPSFQRFGRVGVHIC